MMTGPWQRAIRDLLTLALLRAEFEREHQQQVPHEEFTRDEQREYEEWLDQTQQSRQEQQQ
jgi:hypothetical protein